MKTTRALLFICPIILAFCFNAPGQTTAEHSKAQVIFPFTSNVTGKIGYIDQTGKIIVRAQFEYTGPFSEGLAVVRMGGKFGYIDETGALVIKPQFDAAYQFSEGLALIEINGRNGYIDKGGTVVIEPRFRPQDGLESLGFFSEGLALVEADQEPGYGHRLAYINKQGDLVIKLSIGWGYGNGANRFHEGLAAIRIDGKTGYIDKRGNQVINPQYNSASDFSEGLAVIEVDSKYGYVDKQGNQVIKPQFQSAEDFSKGLARVWIWKEINGRNEFVGGYIDKRGNPAIEPQFVSAKDFSEGFAAIAIANKDGYRYAYIDEHGKNVFGQQFQEAASFSEGLAAVRIRGKDGSYGKWGYINNKGNQVIEPQFEDAGQFFNGLAVVTLGRSDKSTVEPDESTTIRVTTRHGYINTKGEIVFTTNTIAVARERKLPVEGPRGPPSFSTPLAQISIETIPSGAKIYLIPLDDWDADEKLISNESKLLNYLLSVYTPLSSETVIEQVYMALVEVNGKRIRRVFDVNQTHKNEMKLDFSKEK